MKAINKYSKEKKILLVYFTIDFWIQILGEYNIPYFIDIAHCYKLREIFFEYNDLINEIYGKDWNSEIKKDINRYSGRDEFAFILDKNIQKMLSKDEELSNSEKLEIVAKYNPYYKEEKYINCRNTHIFDCINLDRNTQAFIETFKKLHFETMFKDNIMDFLNKMTSKIINISNFGTILEIINVNRISKVEEFFAILKDKYEQVIERQIESLSNKELYDAIKIVAKFVDLIYIHEKNCDFIENKINKLDRKISSLIYYELIRRCKGDKYKKMKEYIYKKFLDKLGNIGDIMGLIDNLDDEDKKVFMEELMKKCQFTEEEYFSKNENEKIVLLCELNDKRKLDIIYKEYYFLGIIETLDKIYKKLGGEILLKKLEEFLANEEKQVIKRLRLINIILSNFSPEGKYVDLKKTFEQIKEVIKELGMIKNSLSIFHRNSYQKEIRDISIIIRDIEEKNICNYKSERIKKRIQNFMELKFIVEQVEKVKDFILFKVLYDETNVKDDGRRFDCAFNKLYEINDSFHKNISASQIYKENKEIFNKIKEMLSNNESKTDVFIKQMIDYFKIEKKLELINELTLIFKNKK